VQQQIFYAKDLSSFMPLRRDLRQMNLWLEQLLQDEEISDVGPFVEQGYYSLRGAVSIRNERMTLIFEHGGSRKNHQISALKVDGNLTPDIELHLRTVMRQNGQALNPPLAVCQTAFQKQPDIMRIRTRSSSTSSGQGTSTPYEKSPGYRGEKLFVDAAKIVLPEREVDWVNREKESGLPYDVLIGGRVAVDVKATGSARSYVALSVTERAFRERHLAHHVIALVTLKADPQSPPLAIDLYTGPEGRKIALDALFELVDTLPPLPRPVLQMPPTGHGPMGNDLRGALPERYFQPGRFESSDEGPSWHFDPDGTWVRGEQAGTYRLSGHRLIAWADAPGRDEATLTLSRHPTGWTLTAADGTS
jgi:Domain of unknown function (DUF3883)